MTTIQSLIDKYSSRSEGLTSISADEVLRDLADLQTCEHKFVLLRSDSYWRNASRYSRQYVHIDYFFCEKCLEERENKKDKTFGDTERLNIPDWAKTITKEVAGYGY